MLLASTSGCSLWSDTRNFIEDMLEPSAVTCRPVGNKPIAYVVRQGDTLSEIAQCFKTDWHRIASYNKIKQPDKLKAGQKLTIPAKTWNVASKPQKPKSQKPKQPAYASSGGSSSGKITWLWPTQGKVIRKFSPKSSGKQGILISGKMNQKIVASAGGTVVYSGEGLIGYGRLVIVQHANEFLTAYAHNDRLLVAEGEQIRAGQTIAYMGKTGADRPQLHFEMRRKGTPVNPLKYLPKR